MVQRMERAGFVVRQDDPNDQRISRVYLTEAGRRVQDNVQEIWHTMEEETFGNLTSEEQNLLAGFLQKIRDNLMAATGMNSPHCS
jgi:DNA-binding MarR family transcriptional regulator